MSDYAIIERLLLSVLLGGLVGLEREMHGRAAGFRTHILVCIGATLTMLVSAYGFPLETTDPARLAAQVVSGIGFLGAGTILREGTTIRGLTTAASLWVVGGIGLAIGIGFYLGAVAATILVVITLFALHKFEHRYLPGGFGTFEIRAIDRVGLLGELASILGEHDVNILSMEMHQEQGEMKFTFSVNRMTPSRLPKILEEVQHVEGVILVNYR